MFRTAIVLFIALAVFSAGIADPLGFAEPPLICDRPHEEYECGSACQTRCDNLHESCPIVNIKCNDACYCKSGYAREGDDNSPCIPIQNCP